MLVEDVDIIWQDKRGKQAAQESYLLYAQEFCDRTIGPHDQSQFIEGKIADRGMFIEVGILIPGIVQFRPASASDAHSASPG